MKSLSSVPGAIALGVILALILSFALRPTGGFGELGLAIWLHILAGVMWIGLLYYFNVVPSPQTVPASPQALASPSHITPRALSWLRWASLATWLTGIWYLARARTLASAVTLGHLGHDRYGLTIGVGGWLGTLMLFNVWVFICPSYRKLLGLASASEPKLRQARRVAQFASRANFVLSIPLLLCMGATHHALPF